MKNRQKKIMYGKENFRYGKSKSDLRELKNLVQETNFRVYTFLLSTIMDLSLL